MFIWFTVLLFYLKGTTVITFFPGVRVVMFSACLAAKGMGVLWLSQLLPVSSTGSTACYQFLQKGKGQAADV